MTMFQRIQRFGVLALMACASCGNAEENSMNTAVGQDQASLPVTTVASEAGDSTPVMPTEPVKIQSVTPMPGTQAPPVQNVGTTAPGMNPPHGQPGHRCEIAVGAPLSSAPAAAPLQITSSGSNPVEVKPMPIAPPTTGTPPAPVKTPPGMNPPHGEPGHDCSIAVGAPLKK